MSIYKHNYRAYAGKVTPVWTRVLVIARYGYAEAWSSKITVGIFVLSMLPCIVSLFGIYLANNPMARALIGGQGGRAIAVDGRLFFNMLEIQCWLALVLASWVAPRLITYDLADNAMPILLSHPISRFGYVLGKFVALFVTLSLMTWIPLLILFVYAGYASPVPWFAANLSVAGGVLAGAMIWIVFLCVLCLALSSWVKWRIVATGIIFGAVFVPAGVGGIMSAVLRTKWGFLLNIPFMMTSIWSRLLGAHLFIRPERDLPTFAIAAMLVIACLVCLGMLNARIRAREVVRG